MKEAVVIVAFAGTGKTYLGAKYKNVLDLDHLFYRYIYSDETMKEKTFEQLKGIQNRTINPFWPENYFNDLFKNIKKYEVILLPSSQEIIEYLDKIDFKYILCYPERSCKSIYLKRYETRGTNQSWINRVEEEFEDSIADFDLKSCKKIILRGDETLEDKLKQMNMLA